MNLRAMIVCNQSWPHMPTSVTASMKKVRNLNEGRVSEFGKREILHVTFTTIHKNNKNAYLANLF